MSQEGVHVGADVELEGIVIERVDLRLEGVFIGEGACNLGGIHLSLVRAGPEPYHQQQVGSDPLCSYITTYILWFLAYLTIFS